MALFLLLTAPWQGYGSWRRPEGSVNPHIWCVLSPSSATSTLTRSSATLTLWFLTTPAPEWKFPLNGNQKGPRWSSNSNHLQFLPSLRSKCVCDSGIFDEILFRSHSRQCHFSRSLSSLPRCYFLCLFLIISLTCTVSGSTKKRYIDPHAHTWNHVIPNRFLYILFHFARLFIWAVKYFYFTNSYTIFNDPNSCFSLIAYRIIFVILYKSYFNILREQVKASLFIYIVVNN